MPSHKCGTCAKFLSPLEGAKCNNCGALFHRACVALPSAGILVDWCCTDCKKKLARKQYLDTPATAKKVMVVPQQISPDIMTVPTSFKEEIHSELRTIIREELLTLRKAFQEEFDRLRSEVAQLRADRDHLLDSVKVCNARMDGVDSRLSALEQQAKCNSDVDEAVAGLRRDLNDRDQQLLANDMEISNLPEESGENLAHTIKLIATKLGVSIEERDIVSVHRSGGRHINVTSPTGAVERRPRPVVVRLARRDLRDELLRSARVRRGANTADLGMSGAPRRFYLNERLTKVNRQLFRQAREVGRQYGWRFVWSKHGRILARRKPDDMPSVIHTEADLPRLFGPVKDIST